MNKLLRGRAGASSGSSNVGSTEPGFSLWVGLVIVILCAVYASQVRLGQLAAWENQPELYVASGVPMMTTLDAYYSLRLARLHAAGTFVPEGPLPARHYSRPEPGKPGDWFDQRDAREMPLLSTVISVLSPLFGGDINKTGLLLSPLLSSLFMIPLFLCCWRLGVPAAGLMGGLVASFCIDYYQRTSVGWVDTDALNLFFPWTVSFIILAMHGDQQRERLLLLSAMAGAVLYVFFLWYPKPGLTLLYVCTMAIYLRLVGVSWRRTAMCVVTLVIFANVLQFAGLLENLNDFIHRYFWPASQLPGTASAIWFPDVWSTISEDKSLHWSDTLKRILGRADLSAIGLIAFAAFALWRWRQMAALGPLLLLGTLALVSSQRFIFYLSPFAGIGWGLIVSLITKRLLSQFAVKSNKSADTPESRWPAEFVRGIQSAFARPGFRTAVAYLAVVGVYAGWFAPASGMAFVPRPAIPAPVFRDLQILADRLPANSRMWTWWDIGLAIVDTTGFGVYHDGAAQYTPQTNLVAASFVNRDQRVMHDVIGFVDRQGNRGIGRVAPLAGDLDGLLTEMRLYRRPPGEVPIYVLYTPDMLLKYPAMRTLGTLGPATETERGSPGIRWLQCERLVDDALHCGRHTLDLRSGWVSRKSPPGRAAAPTKLRRAVMVEGGRVIRQQEYANAGQLTVEIIFKDGAVRAVYLLDEPAFESNLNQMFVLGHYDPAYFEEAFNDFPYARAFRVLGTP